MKIRIEGCTGSDLSDCSGYLSLGKVYEAREMHDGLATINDDDGDSITIDMRGCQHLPDDAQWVEVQE